MSEAEINRRTGLSGADEIRLLLIEETLRDVIARPTQLTADQQLRLSAINTAIASGANGSDALAEAQAIHAWMVGGPPPFAAAAAAPFTPDQTAVIRVIAIEVGCAVSRAQAQLSANQELDRLRVSRSEVEEFLAPASRNPA